MHMARALAISYGDGLSNNEFWKSDMYFFNLEGKVFSKSCFCKVLRVTRTLIANWLSMKMLKPSVEVSDRGSGACCSRGWST